MTIHSHLARCSLLMFLVSLLVGAPASADSSARLEGKVVGFSGKALKKVSIELTSPDDPSLRLETRSDKKGLFELTVADPTLSYELHLERSGFLGLTTEVFFEAGATVDRTFTMLTQSEVDEGKAEILREREQPKTDPAVKLYNEGATAFSGGDMTTAKERFEAALGHDPEMLLSLSAMCLVTMSLEEWDETTEYAARTLAIEPTDLRGLLASYRAAKSLGDDTTAQVALEGLRAIGADKDIAGPMFNEGVDKYQSGKKTEAIALFEQAAELDPSMIVAHVALAGLYLNKGEYDASLAASAKAIELAPDNDKALTYRFEACLRTDGDCLGDSATALFAVDPAYVSKGMNEQAFDRFEDNRYEEAKELVSQVLALDQGDPRANYVMGLILVNAGDNEAAGTHLQTFVDAAPNDPDAEAARRMIEAIQ
jgi:tetratricopeptide (TPR) repeat protein